MNRQQICDSPDLKDLPYKIELNRRNQIIISPARLMYGAYQSEIVKKMADLVSDGRIDAKCAIRTPQGTKVPDAAWFSSVRREQVKNEDDTRTELFQILPSALFSSI